MKTKGHVTLTMPPMWEFIVQMPAIAMVNVSVYVPNLKYIFTYLKNMMAAQN